jgi:hypothetical protein
MLSAVMLNAVMLSAVMLSAVMLYVMAPNHTLPFLALKQRARKRTNL